MKRILSRSALPLAALAALVSSSPISQAANGTWNVDATGNWTTASNWLNNTIPGSSIGDVASFTYDLTANQTVTVDGTNKIIGVLNIGDTNGTNSFSLSGNTALYFNNGASAAQINQTSTSNGDTITNVPIGINASSLVITNASTKAFTIGSAFQGGNAGTKVITVDNTSAQGVISLTGRINNGSADAVSLVKNGSGTLKLYLGGGTSGFSGGVTLNAGTLEFGNSLTALGTGTFTINGGTITNGYGSARTLTTNNAQAWNADFTFGAAGASGSDLNLGTGDVTLSATRTVTTTSTNSARTLTVGGAIGDGGNGYGLIKAGNAQLRLDGANTFSGATKVNTGVLVLGNSLALQNSAIDTTGPGKINLSGITTSTFGGLTGGTALATVINSGYTGSLTAITLNTGTGKSYSYTGVIADGATGMSFTKTGSGSQTLGGANTYTGATTISAGTLILMASGTISNSSGINLGTSDSQGTLDVTSKTSGYTIGASQTLSGYGSVLLASGKTLTVSGNLAPGNSAGIVTIGGNLSLASTSTTTMELVNSTLGAGSGFDQISLSGTGLSLTYGGALVIDVSLATQVGSYQLFTGFSTQTGTFSSITFSQAEAAGTFDYSTGVLTLTAVPEPGTVALVGFSLLGLLVFRRRNS
ncbi:PEP-CTERM protein-sorting domain-containing protein [Terrimicrobium sacchariphilum]|uniref:PEP-CTERM protein-sorting domain-containing protein n=1 Tax=Terrimicrobium sacchariphilum TaxID=690879 RepID=A0A146G736_TERSA|nr:PEP-CTERM sorting domain-containing protein [Terrimicrobium sacchariphilum]GAT32578.1 PEP-CTERM protein-sorting domain-containing protein [Terrimicrobium sacchariphilum]